MPLKPKWKQNLGLIPALLCVCAYSVYAQSLQLGDLTAFHKDGLAFAPQGDKPDVTFDAIYGRGG